MNEDPLVPGPDGMLHVSSDGSRTMKQALLDSVEVVDMGEDASVSEWRVEHCERVYGHGLLLLAPDGSERLRLFDMNQEQQLHAIAAAMNARAWRRKPVVDALDTIECHLRVLEQDVGGHPAGDIATAAEIIGLIGDGCSDILHALPPPPEDAP